VSDPTLHPTKFETRVEDLGRMVAVRVRGDVDIATAPKLQRRIESLAGHRRGIVIDLGEVTFMDLHGLHVLVEAARLSSDGGPGFWILRPSPPVSRLLDLTGLANQLPVLREEPHA
jgi:anti-anti-sigma factor